MEDIALKYGYRALLCCTEYDSEKEKSALQMLMSNSADAVIVASCSEQIKDLLNNCSIPVVALDAMLIGANVKASIFCDYYYGGGWLRSICLNVAVKISSALRVRNIDIVPVHVIKDMWMCVRNRICQFKRLNAITISIVELP